MTRFCRNLSHNFKVPNCQSPEDLARVDMERKGHPRRLSVNVICFIVRFYNEIDLLSFLIRFRVLNVFRTNVLPLFLQIQRDLSAQTHNETFHIRPCSLGPRLPSSQGRNRQRTRKHRRRWSGRKRSFYGRQRCKTRFRSTITVQRRGEGTSQ